MAMSLMSLPAFIALAAAPEPRPPQPISPTLNDRRPRRGCFSPGTARRPPSPRPGLPNGPGTRVARRVGFFQRRMVCS